MTRPTPSLFVPYHAVTELHQRGTRADQPAPGDVVAGTLYGLTDEADQLERSNGTVWERYAPIARSANVFPYRADAQTTARNDPGAGYLRWNTKPQTAATSLYLDWLTADGYDAHVLFILLPRPSRFLLQDEDVAVNYQVWTLTNVIEYPDWFEVVVTLEARAAAP